MYGPSFLFGYDLFANRTYPTGLWCPLYYPLNLTSKGYSSTQTCLQATGMTKHNDTDITVYLREGTITPLQNVFGKVLKNSGDLVNVPVDLHVVAKNGVAEGYLLVDLPNQEKDFCYFYMQMADNILKVEDVSTKYGGSGKCQGYKGFSLGKVYVYQADTPTFQKAEVKVKGDSLIDMAVTIGGSYVAIFELPADKTVDFGQVSQFQFYNKV